MRAKYAVIGVVIGVLLSTMVVLAGNLDPPSGPNDAASQMYTLEQIYDRLDTGAVSAKMTSFTEPVAGPGTTGHTLDEVMGLAMMVGNPDPPCFNNIHRYVDCGNGTVHDTVTNLIWLKDANCYGQLKYAEANEAAAGLEDGECGLTDGSSPGDWRLPTDHEWWATTRFAADTMGCTGLGENDPPSLTNLQGTACFTVLQGAPPQFDNVQVSDYWSSTATEDSPYLARYVSLWGGAIGNKNKDLQSLAYVWPVRGGPVPPPYP